MKGLYFQMNIKSLKRDLKAKHVCLIRNKSSEDQIKIVTSEGETIRFSFSDWTTLERIDFENMYNSIVNGEYKKAEVN